MKKKLTAVVVVLVSSLVVLAGAASAEGATSLCPEASVACKKPARPDADGSSKSSTARPKIVPQRTTDRQGREVWRSGNWLME